MTPPDACTWTAPRSLVRWCASIGRHPRFALTIAVASLGLAGLTTIPPIDRDEPDFAQAARQMLESHNFIDIRFQDAPLYEKPVLTYWLQAGSAALFSSSPERNQIWAYRLPSVLAVWLSTLLTYELGLALFNRRTALAAAAMFASMLLVQSQAHQARADALLLAAMLGTVLPLARVYVSRHLHPQPSCTAMAALFWASLAAAILIKGPIVPFLLALELATLMAMDRSWHWIARLRPGWGIPLFLLIVLPWPLAMLRQRGAAFFLEAWETDILPKLTSAQESHGAPPLAYTLLSPVTLWPTILLLPRCVELAWRNYRNPSVRFCVAASLPGWLAFELAPTKLPHYVLPLVPLLVVLMAVRARKLELQPPSLMSSRIGVALFMFGGALISAMILLAEVRFGSGVGTITIIGVALLLASMILTAAPAWRRGVEHSVGGAAFCGMLATLVIFAIAIPGLQRLWVADRAASVARTIAGPTSPTLVVGYSEPSLVFLLGTRTRFVEAKEAVAALQAGSSRVAIVAGLKTSEFVVEARARGMELQQNSTVSGIDPVHGRPIELGVWSPRGTELTTGER